MTYNRKVAVLSALAASLAAVYILSVALDPDNRRSEAFAWLDSSLVVMADAVEISGPAGATVLRRRNDVWFFHADASASAAGGAPSLEFPVKQERVGDLFALLTRRDAYPRRASSQEAAARLGLTEDRASRITVRGGAGLPLLDLLVGAPDALGREVYLRRAGWNQIYSAEDDFGFFTESRPLSWYDLRLFAPGTSGDTVQQAEIVYVDTADTGEGGEAGARKTLILRRSGGRWVVPGNEAAPLDTVRVETWLRQTLEAEADDFAPSASDEAAQDEAAITLWFGDGSTAALRLGPADGQGNCRASVSGSSFAYLLAERTFNSLFRLDYLTETTP